MSSIRGGTRAFACAVLVAISGAAAAAPASVKSIVNLRAAPGTDSQVIVRIPPGTVVEANNCESGWCAVDWQGKSGYAISTALDTGTRATAARRPVRSAPATVAPAMPGPAYEADDLVGGAPVVGAPLLVAPMFGAPLYYGPPVAYYGYRYPYRYRAVGYSRYRPYYGYRYGSWRRRW